MNSAFDAGFADALTKAASARAAVRALAANQDVQSAVGGALLGAAASPSDDRWRYVPHGAVMGLVMNRHRSPGKALSGGGQHTPTAVPSHKVT